MTLCAFDLLELDGEDPKLVEHLAPKLAQLLASTPLSYGNCRAHAAQHAALRRLPF